jgi:DNA repair protein RadC
LAEKILDRPGAGLNSEAQQIAFFTALEVSGLTFLKGISGLGPAGQSKLLAAFELGRRYHHYRSREAQSHLKNLSLPKLARLALQKITQNSRSDPQEWLAFIPLDRSGELGEFCLVEKGARTHVNVDPAELFARVLGLRPQGFFLVHNHPSGNTEPSPEDQELTHQVANVSKQLGLTFFGHWIVSTQSETWLNPAYDLC